MRQLRDTKAFFFLRHWRGKQPLDGFVELLLFLLEQVLQHLPVGKRPQGSAIKFADRGDNTVLLLGGKFGIHRQSQDFFGGLF